MPNDMLWAPRFMGSKYVMRTKENEEYIEKKLERLQHKIDGEVLV
jgi:hypothetical protein